MQMAVAIEVSGLVPWTAAQVLRSIPLMSYLEFAAADGTLLGHGTGQSSALARTARPKSPSPFRA